MGTKRQKIQMELAFVVEGRGEAPMAADKGTEKKRNGVIDTIETLDPIQSERYPDKRC